ncbi:uncharacterized protein [Rutidosis leptorrhynchoides]|uniref:uncharacterized protein n=1 Tax=Rutidosis leptorrhynchoides TaxID=125765 RepID=UPI003A9A1B0A
MSAYDGVVVEKLKLKGKPLIVKSAGVTKKKRKLKNNRRLDIYITGVQSKSYSEEESGNNEEVESKNEYLTPAERKFMQQREKIEQKLLAKMAKKSHRDRIHEFNQYLANLSEHHDIPKVGPG